MAELSKKTGLIHGPDKLAELLEPHALPYLKPALDGDVEAAQSLIVAAGNRNRGMLAVSLWRARIAVPAYRTVLSQAWNHDHQHVMSAAASRRSLEAMFLYAAFPLPDLPDMVRVWRGTADVGHKRAARGVSWTLDRDVACWFALRFGARPLVLAADISKTSIAHFGDDPNEKEVVAFEVSHACVDGDAASWKEGGSVGAKERKR